MSKDRSITIAQLPIKPKPGDEGPRFLTVEVHYQTGGLSFLSGKTQPRGYFVMARAITKLPWGMSFNLMSGVKDLLLEANRYNAKKLEELASVAKDSIQYRRCVDHVIAADKLELVEAPAVAAEGNADADKG